MALEETTERAPGQLASLSKVFDPRRVYVALLVLPLFYCLVRYLPPYVFFGLVLVAAGWALWEFYQLHFAPPMKVGDLVVALGSLGLLLTTMQWPEVLPMWVAATLTLFGIVLWQLASCPPSATTLATSAVLTFGILYIGVTLGHLLLIRSLGEGIYCIFFLTIVTWCGDTGAYYVGRLWGRHKLAPVISPNKTIEGVVGGMALALLGAIVSRVWFLPSLTFSDCLMLGLILTGAGVLGDLVESAFKRSAGVKDSGQGIPGHGGMLDRLDSLLFTGPTFYYYVMFVK